MVALLRFLEHFEVFVELGLVLESGAVNALELRILFVAFVISAGDVGQFERPDVAGAHHVRPGAKINEVAVPIIRNRFAFWDVLDDIEFELARVWAFAEGAKGAAACHVERLLAASPLSRKHDWL